MAAGGHIERGGGRKSMFTCSFYCSLFVYWFLVCFLCTNWRASRVEGVERGGRGDISVDMFFLCSLIYLLYLPVSLLYAYI